MLFGAGRGVRLRPLTDAVPKPALPLLDLPLAGWGLQTLTGSLTPVVVNGSHLAADLMDALSRLDLPGWRPFVEVPEALGTAGTLRALRHGAAPTVVTWNGDVLTDLDPYALLDRHASASRLGTLAVRRVDRDADLEVDGDRVTRFVDRRRETTGGAQFLGIAAFERAALDELPDERPAGLGETLLKTLAERDALAVHEFTGYWHDVGTPAAYLQASLDVLNKRAPRAPVPPPGEVVEVTDGLAYLGPDAQVEPASLRAGAIVLRDAVVAAGATVHNAVVFSGARVPAGAHVNGGVWFRDRIVDAEPAAKARPGSVDTI